MAQRIHVTLIDDLDNTSEADETVRFGLDGKEYSIDLSKKNAKALRDALALRAVVDLHTLALGHHQRHIAAIGAFHGGIPCQSLLP